VSLDVEDDEETPCLPDYDATPNGIVERDERFRLGYDH